MAARPDELVKQTKAANTLTRLTDGGFAAANTDYTAILESLTDALPPNEDGTAGTLSGKMVLLLGAGGVARAVAHALKKAGCVLTISNRTAERGNALAATVEGRLLDWMGRHVAKADIIANATSVGMPPDVDDTPFHAGALQPGLHV